jgi:hypothetical protein
MVSFQYFLWSMEDMVTQPYFWIVLTLYMHGTTLIHESGHALVGALLGLKSTAIRVGTGPNLTIPLPGYPITVGLIPKSGHATFVDEANFPDTWQVLVTYLAGPLALVCSGLVVFLLLRHVEHSTAVIFGVLMGLNGLYDLRANVPDGAKARRVWKVLRARRLTEAR